MCYSIVSKGLFLLVHKVRHSVRRDIQRSFDFLRQVLLSKGMDESRYISASKQLRRKRVCCSDACVCVYVCASESFHSLTLKTVGEGAMGCDFVTLGVS